MPRFMIELPHDPEAFACTRLIELFRATGSHFITHAGWGCADGRHCAWLIVEAATHEEARLVVPPAFRHMARLTLLATFEIETADAMRDLHPDKTQGTRAA
jgi:hypothetical protein